MKTNNIRNEFVREFHKDTKISVSFLHANVVRIRIVSNVEDFSNTGLNRYGFIKNHIENTDVQTSDTSGSFCLSSPTLSITIFPKSGTLEIKDCKTGETLVTQEKFELGEKYARAVFTAKQDEDWIGFGDQTRERLYHRGYRCELNVKNVISYIPVPFFMSTYDYGILVNTTHKVTFDMCASNKEKFFWEDKKKCIDYYFISAKGFRNMLALYTSLTGKPKLPPVWAFGLWYICRTQANDFEVVSDALNFRREKIPCDVIGLEPGWMETIYDTSTKKTWSKERFPIPDYCWNGPHNFFNALKRMGFKLELWLCQEYDLSYEEERRLAKNNVNDAQEEYTPRFHKDGEVDEHFTVRRADKITKKDEPWFEHLKKFIDQGVDFFKQDGAYQVCHHPDRIWGNGMLDSEMHNLYPLFYSRQMYEGFAEYTKRRPVVFTPAGWTGFQAWCGTWTGDTGGRLETLGAMLNTSIVGHSWATNDMEVAEKEGIHFGYLQPWSQINSWNYFRMPWLQGAQLLNMHKYYANLRARLIPYLYSWAYYATITGWPLLIPLTLEFPEDKNCKNNLHQYLLGRDLMVGIYKKNMYFPKGRWKDFWTGKIIEGGCQKRVSWPDTRGGALFVREGALIPFGPVMLYRGEKTLDNMVLYVFPPAKGASSEFLFYEDDGISFKFRDNKEYSVTKIQAEISNDVLNVTIGEPSGGYKGVPKTRQWRLIVALDRKPKTVSINNLQLHSENISWDKKRKELSVFNFGKGLKQWNIRIK